MRATEYGSTNIVEFSLKDVIYIIKDGYECITHFKTGEKVSLSLRDMKNVLEVMPRVFSYELYLPVFLNTNAIASFKTDGVVVDVVFNGNQTLRLKELSRVHFFQNAIPKLEQERQL